MANTNSIASHYREGLDAALATVNSSEPIADTYGSLNTIDVLCELLFVLSAAQNPTHFSNGRR
jgi:hypothetical protein